MKGILFKPEMIKAIVEKRKTVTRRVIKPQPTDCKDGYPDGYDCPPQTMIKYKGKWIDFGDCENDFPRYQVGETVYSKEQLLCNPIWGEASYRDSSPVFIYNEELIKSRHILKWHWKSDTLSSRCMPREAARYFITITDVRAERLQEISLEDCLAEGVNPYRMNRCLNGFRILWNSINKDYPWESNPFIFRYEFEYIGGLNE